MNTAVSNVLAPSAGTQAPAALPTALPPPAPVTAISGGGFALPERLRALRRLPPTLALAWLVIAVAALWALVLLGERLSGTQWLAIGLIVAASMGCAASARRPGAVARPPSPLLADS